MERMYELIHELIEAQARMNERPDSIEFGPASRRCKVYISVTRPEEAAALIDTMRTLAERLPLEAQQGAKTKEAPR